MRPIVLAAWVVLFAACGSAGHPGAGPATRTASGPLGGFVSLRAAAASVSAGCAAGAGLGLPQLISAGLNTDFALWESAQEPPVVYAAAQYVTNRSGTNILAGGFSSRGLRMLLPRNAQPIGLWPCREPVVFYFGNRGQLWMKPLAAQSRRRKAVMLGRVVAPAAFDSRGRLVEIEGKQIHYLGGPTIAPPLPGLEWQIERLAPSPRGRSVFLAEVEKPGCTGNGENTGRLYVISPGKERELATYDSCGNPPLAAWSQDGAKILWTTYGRPPVVTRLHVCDSSGDHRRTLASVARDVGNALWSPDGKTIAFTARGSLSQVAAVTVVTGAVHTLTHIRWRPTPPPRQPPQALLVGWSPNSKAILVLDAQPNGRRTTIEAVGANGGRPRVAIRLTGD